MIPYFLICRVGHTWDSSFQQHWKRWLVGDVVTVVAMEMAESESAETLVEAVEVEVVTVAAAAEAVA